MTIEELAAMVIVLEVRLSNLEAKIDLGLVALKYHGQESMQRVGSIEALLTAFLRPPKDVETEEWKSEPSEDTSEEDPEPTPLPTIKRSTEAPNFEDDAKYRGLYMLTEEGKAYRKLVEDYMKVKNDPVKRHQILHLMVEFYHQTDSKFSEEEKALDFERTDEKIVEMLQLDQEVAAVEWLRREGK